MTLTVEKVGPATVGALIALYERAVGLYAFLIGVNAYHQPGVEAGKKAAAAVLELQKRAVGHLRANKGKAFTSEDLADAIGAREEVESVHWILRHLAANPDHRVKARKGRNPFDTVYSA
jgi:glucose-6-phosphate isomerase